MLVIGKTTGGKWHFLGDAGCAYAEDLNLTATTIFIEPLYTDEYTNPPEDGIFWNRAELSNDFCSTCRRTLSTWKSNRSRSWSPVTTDVTPERVEVSLSSHEDKWKQPCDGCGKPTGATHHHQPHDVSFCLSCVFQFADDPYFNQPSAPGYPLHPTDVAHNSIVVEFLPNRLPREFEVDRKEHFKGLQDRFKQIPIEHWGLNNAPTRNLKQAGYDTIGDVLRASKEELLDVDWISKREYRRLIHADSMFDLATIPGIGRVTADRIEGAGYDTVNALLDASDDELAEVDGVNREMIAKIRRVIDPNDDVIFRDLE